MSHRIATVSDRPELAPLVARWRVEVFLNHPGGCTVEETTALLLAPLFGPKETFVLFDGDQPAGTAGWMRADLETRPDLMPWLGGLFVEPAFHGRRHASTLVRRVEAFAQAASMSVLRLYTSTVEPLCLRLGWQRTGTEQENGQPVTLMRRVLPQASADHQRAGLWGECHGQAVDEPPRRPAASPRRNSPEVP